MRDEQQQSIDNQEESIDRINDDRMSLGFPLTRPCAKSSRTIDWFLLSLSLTLIIICFDCYSYRKAVEQSRKNFTVSSIEFIDQNGRSTIFDDKNSNRVLFYLIWVNQFLILSIRSESRACLSQPRARRRKKSEEKKRKQRKWQEQLDLFRHSLHVFSVEFFFIYSISGWLTAIRFFI